MAKTKSIGTEYQIAAKGDWNQVAKAVATTKQLIEGTRPQTSFFSQSAIDLESGMLKGYLVPKEGESFADYKDRVIQVYVGAGVKGKWVKVIIGNKLPTRFELTQNNGESILRVKSETGKGSYQATISASGNYSGRGASIAEGLRETLEQGSVKHTCKTLDKLI